MKGPRGALFYMGPRFRPFCVLLLENELLVFVNLPMRANFGVIDCEFA